MGSTLPPGKSGPHFPHYKNVRSMGAAMFAKRSTSLEERIEFFAERDVRGRQGLASESGGAGRAAAPLDPDALLTYENVEKRYTPTERLSASPPVVNRMNLTLRRGEILTLLGPSGCGKTTTLRMAIGLERASAGRISFNGRVVDAPAEKLYVPAEKRNMGMVFQSYAIWPHMSVRANVAYPLKVRGASAGEIQLKVERMLSMVGLAAIADRPGTRLSGGQQQRVAVARGLVYGPDLLLMDEPFSNLDVKLREQMRVEVKHLQRQLGISILFVTHDQAEALALSDRIALMHAGNIEQIASPVALYRSPETRVARDFIGRTVLLPGLVEASAPGRTEVMVDGRSRLICQRCAPDVTFRPGERCEVGIRPEHIDVTLDAGAATADVANSVTARILTLLFVGERYEAEVELQNGLVLSLYLSPSQSWQEGQTVRLILPPASLCVWPAAEA
jgi:ABC-type Fe3+/spermidine/putrescine transport system ATPase subunit